MSAGVRRPIEEVLNLSDAERLLILTYHLSGDTLMGLFKQDPRSMKARRSLERLRPVIIYDARVTQETRALPLRIEHHAQSVKGGIHHSKAWCKLCDDRIELTLGSFNLTEGGLYRNRELFKTFTWSSSDPSGSQVIQEFLNFLRNQIATGPGSVGAQLQNFINEADALRQTWDHTSSTIRLLASGYSEESGIVALAKSWRERSSGPAKALFAVSPFFDSNPDQTLLAQLIVREIISEKTHLTLLTARNRHNVLPMLGPYAKFWKNFEGGCDLYLSKNKVKKDDEEWNQIADLTRDLLGEGVRKDFEAQRDLHAKLLALYNGKEWMVYAGSANFTLNAWLGINRELGWVEWLQCDKADLVKSVAAGLSASLTNWDDVTAADKYEELDREENAEEFTGFPHCIVAVYLKKVGDHDLQFEIQIDDEARPDIASYVIRWGKLVLSPHSDPAVDHLYRSQLIPLEGATQLLVCSNLEFSLLTDPEQTFYFPFILEEALRERQILASFKSSEEWLLQFLSPESNSPGFLDDLEGGPDGPGGEPGPEDGREITLAGLKREENRTISMQRFLTQYLQLENRFREQVEEVSKTYTSGSSKPIRLFDPNDPLSFTHYLSLVEQELLLPNGDPAAALFKLGEVLTLLREVQRAVEVSAIRQEFDMPIQMIEGSIAKFECNFPDLCQKPMFQAYLSLVGEANQSRSAL